MFVLFQTMRHVLDVGCRRRPTPRPVQRPAAALLAVAAESVRNRRRLDGAPEGAQRFLVVRPAFWNIQFEGGGVRVVPSATRPQGGGHETGRTYCPPRSTPRRANPQQRRTTLADVEFLLDYPLRYEID